MILAFHCFCVAMDKLLNFISIVYLFTCFSLKIGLTYTSKYFIKIIFENIWCLGVAPKLLVFAVDVSMRGLEKGKFLEIMIFGGNNVRGSSFFIAVENVTWNSDDKFAAHIC